MKQNKTLVIGVSGGIGSGKSTFSAMLARLLNAEIIDADELSRKASESEEVKAAIRGKLGNEVFFQDGKLDRKKLGQKIFSDDKKREELNKIIHPIVRENFFEAVEVCRGRWDKFVIYDCPLLIEANLFADVDIVVIVYAEDKTRIENIINRDNMSREEAQKRIASQLDMKEKILYGDIVIYNDAGLEELSKAASFTAMQLEQLWNKKNC